MRAMYRAAWQRAGLLLRALMLASLLTGGMAGYAAPADPALELQVELDPASRRLQVQARVRPDPAQHAGHFRFTLHPSLQVRSAAIGGQAVPVHAGALDADSGLRLWSVVLKPGTTLDLSYDGMLPALDTRLDHREVLQALPPMSSPAGSFLPAGSGWYPQPARRFAYRIGISVPDGQLALVPGRLLAESPRQIGDGSAPGGRYQARFELTDPVEGVDLMAGPWRVRERMIARSDASPLRLRTYFSAELEAVAGLADAYLDDSARFLARHAAEIGAYPHDGFSVVASPLPTGFGMPGLSYLGAEVLRLPFVRASSLGHEVLHNWWGNGVPVDPAQGNWSEGLTTFMADHAYKEQESASAARAMRLGWLRDFTALPLADRSALQDFRARTHGAAAAVGYGKSAMVFVMLRDLLGEAAFERGLRRFWQTHRSRPAGWQELQQAFEAASGRSLQTFFAQWLERTDAPAVRIVRAVHGPGRLTLTLEQQADRPYALRLGVEIVHAGHSELRWVEFDRARAQLTLPVATDAAAPLGVRLDPDLRTWRMLSPQERPPILRQWIVAHAPRVLVAGAEAELGAAATALAARLFERTPVVAGPEALLQGQGPGQAREALLLVGRHAEIDRLLARAGLPPRPAELDAVPGGTARVWTVQRDGGPPLAVISADDAAALRALQRPLPHYGAQSWLVFEGARVLARGTWAAPAALVAVETER